MKCTSQKVKNWQTDLIESVTDPKELFELLELDPEKLLGAELAAKHFPLRVPRSFIARMQKGSFNDPLLRQVLPIDAELSYTPGYHRDPLQEEKYNPIPGLLHKYHGRVLLTLTGMCGVNCRYCFRRHFAYQENNPGTAGWDKIFEYIACDPSIGEVILSGGDPLIISDNALKTFTQRLSLIPQVKRLRIHSRTPIVLPQRITNEFIDAVTSPSINTILVVHCNHPQEINAEVVDAMQTLKKAGISLLNQAVILKDINDNADILVALSETLFAAGVLPYYLHVLDKVQGAAHFDLDIQIAQQLHREMASKLSGYLVPKLVCEQPGATSKVSLEISEFYTESIF